MKIKHRSDRILSFYLRCAALFINIIFLSSCSFFFPHSSTSTTVPIPALEKPSVPFETVDSSLPAYRYKDGCYIVAIKECDLPQGKPANYITRARQLFVGFKLVHLPVYSKVQIGSREIDRAFVRATLDNTRVNAISYIIPQKDNCISDLVLWRPSPQTADGKPSVSDFEVAENDFKPWLEKIVDSIIE